ncbi:LysR substrate-binding domain-containing protein [Novosphingobium sp. ZW T3_23]|uniref:LysR substrate-binding domain-containing protein n=1 Tax=Novosphingobium sp. ZW T3_23 TaxID=3378084 RepID=UPI003852A87B
MEQDDHPRIDLRVLRQFVAVAEELHFTRAADRLGMSQPPLTAAVRRLEQEVGAVLIERGRKTIRLTSAGAVLLLEAKRLLGAASDALSATRDAANGKHGRVRLGYVGSAMYGKLPGALRRFRRAHPDVQIDLHEMTTVAQVAALRADALDLAIVIPPLGDQAGLQTLPFERDRLAIALPMGHALANAPVIALRNLATEPFVCWPRDQGPGFHDRVTRLCGDAGFSPTIVQEAHGMHAVLSLVAVEAGVAIVPAGMHQVRADEIAYHPIEDPEASFGLVLCRKSGAAQPAVGRLEDTLRS